MEGIAGGAEGAVGLFLVEAPIELQKPLANLGVVLDGDAVLHQEVAVALQFDEPLGRSAGLIGGIDADGAVRRDISGARRAIGGEQ